MWVGLKGLVALRLCGLGTSKHFGSKLGIWRRSFVITCLRHE